MAADSSSFADHHTAHSLALQYEVRLKEDLAKYPNKNGLSPERMQSCFQLLDELLPKMGVYTPVLKNLRKELFDAVFSDAYTSTVLVRKPESTRAEDSAQPSLQRIPYFVLVNRLFDQRNEKAEALQDLLMKLTERVRKKEDALNELEQELVEARKILSEKEQTIRQLTAALRDRSEQIEMLQDQVKAQEKQEANLRSDMRQGQVDYETKLNAANEEISALHHFREGFEAADTAFAEAIPVTRRLKTAFSTKQTQMQNNLVQAKRLQKQLLEIQNKVIEEYDLWIEENKDNLSKFVFDQSDQDAPLTKQLVAAQERFKRGTSETSDELNLLAVQIESIEKELRSAEEEQEKQKQKNSVLGLEGVTGGTAGHDKEEHAESLVPDECLINKYGAMMYTSSNGGKTFSQMKGSRQCSSCGAKTVLCPHRCLETEHVIQLPINCSHIMITRPGVKLLAVKPDAPPPEKRVSDTSIGGFAIGGGKSASAALETIVQRLWEDYEGRIKARRAIPRVLSMDRCLSIIEQFYTRIVWQDDYDVEEEKPVSILDMLYRFFTERYVVPEVAHLGAFDFLQSVVTYSTEKRVVWLFGEQLAGTIDPACFRYVLVLCDLLDLLPWNRVSDYEIFASVAYPFATDDDIEQLAMGFASFAENRPSKDAAYEYILYMLLKHIDPWISEWETTLKNHPTREQLWMSELEFTECMELQCPRATEPLRRRLFLETVAHMPGERDSVPCSLLAYVAAYISLLAAAPSMLVELEQACKAAGRRTSGTTTDGKSRRRAMTAIRRTDKVHRH